MKNPTGDSNPVIYVPVPKTLFSLDLLYLSILGGHIGSSKCVLTLQQKFSLSQFGLPCDNVYVSCHVCQTFKIIQNLKDTSVEES